MLTRVGFNGRRRDHGHGRDRGRRGPCSGRGRVHGRGPIYDCVQPDHVSLPNSRYRSVLRRGAARPNVHFHKAAGSNNLHASDSVLRRDTSNRLPRRIQDRVAQGQ